MAAIDTISLEVEDAAAAEAFYKEAFELDHVLQVRESHEPTNGFHGFTLSLVVAQPSKDAGVDVEGSGSHRLVVTGDAGPHTDPDGFVWESTAG
jgi:catechol 2,3-dioxygenase-like lactoylglutathione lyase family enzyme